MQWLIVLLGSIGIYVVIRKWIEMIYVKADERAQAATSQEKIRFLQRLDHELKNPLTAMQIALANLDDATDPQKRKDIQTSMSGQIVRISHLIGDLRKLASLEKGVIEQTPVDMGELLSEVALIFHDDEAATQRHFTAHFNSDQLPSLIGDRDLLQLAVYNLVDNARKFTHTDDAITIKAYVNDNSLTIQVTDTGRGIPESDLPHVWEDLYRSPDVQGIPGSGVGLAMVKGIIELHGGSVNIHSEYGIGTTVTLKIPIENNNDGR